MFNDFLDRLNKTLPFVKINAEVIYQEDAEDSVESCSVNSGTQTESWRCLDLSLIRPVSRKCCRKSYTVNFPGIGASGFFLIIFFLQIT